jgi:tetratricopeptide (TPR) repeat protein
MGLFLSCRLRLGSKLAALPLLVCIGVGVGGMLGWRFSHPKITDQELLRETVSEWKRAGEPGNGPNYQIFEQQAAQGYYDDAATTARLFKRADDVQWSTVELAKIRAENGDIRSAKNAVNGLAGSDVRAKATEAIALIQAHQGDLSGALETVEPLGPSDQIFLAFGNYQIERGDFEGALDTAERTKSGYQLFYDIGDALRVRGEQSRARNLATHMKDRKLAVLFLDCAGFTLWPRKEEIRTIQATPCDYSWLYATEGKFAEADAVILKNKCSNVSFVAARQYAVDPSGAEQLLRANADKEDLARGLGELVKAAAEKGNITEGLRFLGDVQSLSRPDSVSPEVHDIARAWTIRDGPKAVIQWARSRPTTEQRTWALIGMAEALGHATPRRYCL